MKSKKVKHSMYKLLACPACKGELDFDLKLNKNCFCKACSIRYPIQDGVVDFLSKCCDTSNIDNIKQESKLKTFLRKVYMIIRVSNTFKTKRSRDRIPNLINSLNADDFSINVGAGNTNYSPKIINLEVEKTENGDIIADGRNLPIKSSSVSLVISQAVLEHTPDTNLNIAEIDRILKNNGLLYIEVPWMQTYHAHPHDYFRFTHQGLKSYLKNFDIIDQGVVVGPASAMSLNLRMFLATLFSFGNKSLFVVFGVVFAWLTFPLKYLDFFLESGSLSYYSASGIYVLARKKN